MTRRKVGELVFDFDVYPRASIDTQHMSYMREALEAGQKMPPIVICKKSSRIVDGFHRSRVYIAMYGPEHMVEVIEKTYPTEADLFRDAILLNASHGRILSRHDRVHCTLVAEKLNLTIDDTASALGMTVDKLEALRVDRLATISIAGKQKGEPVPLKNTIRHMKGRILTQQQAAANSQLSGMNQLFYVNQLILLLENGLLDSENEDLIKRLHVLASLIRKLKVAA